MRPLVRLLVVVTILSAVSGAAIDVNAGYTIDVNLFISTPVTGTTWLGLYGSVGAISGKYSWTYYSTPFAQITNLTPTNEVRLAELNLTKTAVGYPSVSSPSNWYAVVSPASDVNLYYLNTSCDDNIDVLIEGNFCPECLPSKTYDTNSWIVVNDRNLCAKETNLYTGILSYVLEWNGLPVYLTPLQNFTLDGNTYNFAFLVSVDGNDLYFYLTRKNIVCGDGVCDPGEETNCGDCVSLTITVNPTSQEANAGDVASYAVELKNEGNRDLVVYLSLEEVSVPSGSSYAVTFSERNVTVAANSTYSVALTLASNDPGDYRFRVIGTVAEVNVPSNTFLFRVLSPTTEQPPPEGGAPAPTEENVTPVEENKIVVTPRGYYIPWLGCISYLHVFSPDEVTLYLNEEKNVPVVIQNAGSCDENITFYIEGIEENFYEIPETNFFLQKRTTKALQVLFRGVKPGVYEVHLVARGFYESKRKMTVVVLGEEKGVVGCDSRVMIMAPDVVEIVEGEEFNTVLEIVNEGTCIESVKIRLTKESAGVTVTIDARDLKLPPGERFLYKPPRLAADEYKLTAQAGGLTKEVLIVVKPRSVVSTVVEEIIVRARFVILLILLLIVLGAASYIRSRYFS